MIPSGGRGPLAWKAIADEGRLPVLVVRHGQTAWNVERRFLGRSDVPLDDAGVAQAERLATHLVGVPARAVVTSPLRRARATADILARGRPLEVEEDLALVELHQGELEGKHADDMLVPHAAFFAAWRADPTDVRVPGGETLRECQARALEALTAIAERHGAGSPIVVVTHQMVIASLVLASLGLPLGGFRDVKLTNTAVTVLAFDGRFHVECVGNCDHL
jgi:broad specificity phosphatase PhoE